jgi:hypothetical protein
MSLHSRHGSGWGPRMESLFDFDEPRKNVHSCTGAGCSFCEYVNGTQAKDRATAVIVKDPEWTLRATQWRRSLNYGACITADDLLESCGHPVGSPNQIGALFNSWAKLGALQIQGTIGSARASNHSRKIILWRVV